ncbi:MAG: DUF126 domain-containing protein [Candidatus Methanomethylophilaceae archaeon]
MIIKGRSITPGIAKGKVIKYDEAFSFLGGVDTSTGDLRVADGNIAGKVFVFPKGKGSTVGSFVMYDLMVHGTAPVAVINRSAETIVTTGAVISSIPMVDMIDTDILRDGDIVSVNGTDGSISIETARYIRTVSSAIMVKGRVLVLHRPDTARSFPGAHSLVSGKIEPGESAEDAAAREIMEETRIPVDKADRVLEPFYVREKDIVWEVTAFLYILDSAEPVLNEENVAFEWLTPEQLKADPKAVTGVPGALDRLLNIQ